MSACKDRDEALHALLDGELDASHTRDMEQHLKTCSGCAAEFASMKALRSRLRDASLREPAPAGLRSRVDAMLDAETAKTQPRQRRSWLSTAWSGWVAAGAMSAVAAGLLVAQIGPSPGGDLEAQLIGSHVRSLQEAHLMDVPTSDRHTVKPWFNGKIDFAPPVPDLAEQGFPLAGGRLDYAEKRTIAALVYRRRAHVINVFVMPESPARLESKRDSYSVVRWNQGGLDFWAVSDVDLGDLEAFRAAFQAATKS